MTLFSGALKYGCIGSSRRVTEFCRVRWGLLLLLCEGALVLVGLLEVRGRYLEMTWRFRIASLNH